MKKILLISTDENLYNFCCKLQVDMFYIQWISPFTDDIEEFSTQCSLVLLDFELMKNGYNALAEKLPGVSMNPTIIPLVKEKSVIAAMKLLKYSYEEMVLLPCCIEYLQAYIMRYIQRQEIMCANSYENNLIASFIGNSCEICAFKKNLLAIAGNDISVIILGETGTGKSFAARLIHQLSKRSKQKFVEENVAAIQETLIEGELFGTKVGAYTGAISRIGLLEYANKGTLFLDEIGSIKNIIQAKLLQVLETGVYRPVGSVEVVKSDVRLITATNVSLDVLKNKKFFREDLYYRISGRQLIIPPLRSRKEDIYLLAKHFLQKVSTKTGIVKKFTADAISKLESHSWPGNVRELERCIECAYHMALQTTITASDILFVS